MPTHPIIERIKSSQAQTLTARIAEHYPELTRLVALRHLTWVQVGAELGVTLNTLKSALKRAEAMRARWEGKGIAVGAIKSLTRAGAKTGQSTARQPSLVNKNPNDYPAGIPTDAEPEITAFPKLPTYQGD